MRRLLHTIAALMFLSGPALAADDACDAPREPVAKMQADFVEQNANVRKMPDDLAQIAITTCRQATGDHDTALDGAYLVLNEEGDKAVVVLANGACAVKMSRAVPLGALPTLLGGRQLMI